MQNTNELNRCGEHCSTSGCTDAIGCVAHRQLVRQVEDHPEQRQTKLLIWALALVCCAVLVAALVVAIFFAKPRPVFDCSSLIGGWHPDVPESIKKRCEGGRK
jgi:hypothetical protein